LKRSGHNAKRKRKCEKEYQQLGTELHRENFQHSTNMRTRTPTARDILDGQIREFSGEQRKNE
jgi:hypothetical protein